MAIQEKFPSIRPSLNLDFANTKTLDPRITFSRASTATYYDGKTVAKAEENLLIRSQEFDRVWEKNGVTVSANTAVAPDGTTTADSLTEDSVASFKQVGVYNSLSAGAFAYSVFVKPNGCDNVALNLRQGVVGTILCGVNFNVPAGTHTVNNGSGFIATVLSLPNGWYRLSITGTLAEVATYAQVRLTRLGINYEGDGTSGIYLWGAQLEQRSSVTAYSPTTTQPITNYIPVLQTAAANVARFDHNPVTGESLGLLIEEQRTNLLLRSQEFDNAYWSKAEGAVSANAAVAPDGTLTADKLFERTGLATHAVYRGSLSFTATAHTLSIRAKAGERNFIWVRANHSTSTSSGAIFDLTTGGTSSVENCTASSKPLGNGWFECSITFTPTTTASGVVYAYVRSSANTSMYTGDGYSGIYIWGAQLEAGAFATSYIPTTTSQVTRSADHAVMTGSNFSSWYRQDEGSFVAKFSVNNAVTSASKTILNVNDGSENNRIWLRISQTVVDFVVSAVGQGQVDTPGFNYVSSGLTATVSIAYKKDDFVCAMDPFSPQTDTSGLVPVCDRLNIGSRLTAGSETLHGHIRKIAYYPRRLTNTQLQALTT